MAEIATWSAILNKTGLGKTSNECPTKAELLALNNGKDSMITRRFSGLPALNISITQIPRT